MRTVDRQWMRAGPDVVYRAAARVEHWPALLPHYRRVHVRERRGEAVIVEMAAWRPFGPVRYPTWWVSEMRLEPGDHRIRYHHIEGITRGMDVRWEIEERTGGSEVTIIHEWSGPDWPLVGATAANWVIGPVFIHGIASRTLAGIAKHVEVASR